MVISLQEWRNKRSSAAPLGQNEWKVVELARTDGARSLNPEGFLARIARDLFGMPIARSLADRKLEALRRFSVRAWYWDLIRSKDLYAFADAGYSSRNVLEILSHVGLARGFTPSVEEDPVLVTPRRGSTQRQCG